MLKHRAQIAHVEITTTQFAFEKSARLRLAAVRRPACRFSRAEFASSFVLWIEHKPLAVDYLAVLSDRHVDAGAALSIG